MPGEAPAPVLAVCPFIASLHMENPSIGGGVAVAEEIAAPEKSGFLLEWETGQVGSESLDGFGCSFVGRQVQFRFYFLDSGVVLRVLDWLVFCAVVARPQRMSR